eukprot:11272858-Karenia_brevis.AAC.1
MSNETSEAGLDLESWYASIRGVSMRGGLVNAMWSVSDQLLMQNGWAAKSSASCPLTARSDLSTVDNVDMWMPTKNRDQIQKTRNAVNFLSLLHSLWKAPTRVLDQEPSRKVVFWIKLQVTRLSLL